MLPSDTAKREVLCKIRSLNDSTAQKDTIDWIYKGLSILDTKASGLLRVNAIFVTLLFGFIAFSKNIVVDEYIDDVFSVIAAIAIIALLISSLFSFFVIQVSWKFLKHAVRKNDGSYDLASEELNLAGVLIHRTHLYWLSWGVTLFVMVAILLVVSFYLLRVWNLI